jgi:hypothetical protein
MEGPMARKGSQKLSRDQLVTILPPAGTDTFKPISHADLIANVIDSLSYRHVNVVKDEYAVSEDGMKVFGVLELESGFDGARFALGIRNANDRSMRLALTVGYRVLVCDNLAFHGDFTPVLAKHSKNFNLQDALSIGIDRMQRNFVLIQKQVGSWRGYQLSDAAAKLHIYHAFIEDALEAPKHLARRVNDLYFNPVYPEFLPRNFWSLSNAFTSAFKELDPIPQFKATAKLGEFLQECGS